MSLTLPRWVDAPARLLMSALFLLSGIGKLTAVSATQGYMTAHGVPAVLLWPAAAFEIGSGALLLLGLWTRPLGVLLAGWCLLTVAIFHTAFADQNQLINFLKDLAMAGGFLLLARAGATGFGLGGRRVGTSRRP
jgi:putative oxidoreductase